MNAKTTCKIQCLFYMCFGSCRYGPNACGLQPPVRSNESNAMQALLRALEHSAQFLPNALRATLRAGWNQLRTPCNVASSPQLQAGRITRGRHGGTEVLHSGAKIQIGRLSRWFIRVGLWGRYKLYTFTSTLVKPGVNEFRAPLLRYVIEIYWK